MALSYEIPVDAVAESEYGPDYAAVKAIDNDMGTVWFGESGHCCPNWIYFDLGSKKFIGGVKAAVGNSDIPQTHDIQVSDDALSWETVVNGWVVSESGVLKEKTFPVVEGQYLRLYITASARSYGACVEFRAGIAPPPSPAPPTVSTLDATEVTLTGAKLNGEVTALYPTPCDERGFEWGTESGVYPNSWTETNGFGPGDFDHSLTGLLEGVTYFYRAKAHNSEGWGYGAEKSFGTGQSTTTEVDVRLSDVDPPEPEPKRTIYRDIVNLPDPVKLGITIRYFNHDDVGLYMQITGSGAGYTFGTENLGLLASGANAYRNLDEFASKAKPSVGDLPNGEMEETVTLILRGYTDDGYLNLKWTFERVVTIHWINSADPAFTIDVLNNFDDGTVQGWAVANEAGNDGVYPTIAVAVDYVLSAPYSCHMRQHINFSGIGITHELRARLYKSFSTPDRPKVFAVFDIRLGESHSAPSWCWQKYLEVQKDSAMIVHLGKTYDAVEENYMVEDKWIRIVVPLPRNDTVELRLVHDFLAYCHSSGLDHFYGFLWLDDFKIISK